MSVKKKQQREKEAPKKPVREGKRRVKEQERLELMDAIKASLEYRAQEMRG